MNLDELIVEFGAIEKGALPVVDAVVAKGALNVKNDAKRRVQAGTKGRGKTHVTAYPYSIGYDLGHVLGASSAIIGPDKDKRQGALGNLLEYGSVNNAPIPHLQPALDAEAPKFEAAIAAAVDKMWA